VSDQIIREDLRGDAEISRLRLQAAHAEVERLRLTDEERQAMMRAMYRVVGADSAILWSLLERTK
jgi:hypothetical protein